MNPKTPQETVEIFRTPQYVGRIGDILFGAMDSLEEQEIGVYSQRFEKLLNRVHSDELMVPKHLVVDNHNEAALHDAYTIFCSAHLLLESSKIEQSKWGEIIKGSKNTLLSIGGLEDQQEMPLMAYLADSNVSGRLVTTFTKNMIIDWTDEVKEKIEEIKVEVPTEKPGESGCPARHTPVTVGVNTTNLMFHFWDEFVDYIYGEPK